MNNWRKYYFEERLKLLKETFRAIEATSHAKILYEEMKLLNKSKLKDFKDSQDFTHKQLLDAVANLDQRSEKILQMKNNFYTLLNMNEIFFGPKTQMVIKKYREVEFWWEANDSLKAKLIKSLQEELMYGFNFRLGFNSPKLASIPY